MRELQDPTLRHIMASDRPLSVKLAMVRQLQEIRNLDEPRPHYGGGRIVWR